ncbi:MAG: SpoIIIAH-like family protein [Firmicutes bacterium]|nr:SpoIIIAH-like family protein [Bacillota bacterium]
MIIKKRTLYLISLVILLVVIGYINHQLNKQSMKQASTEYQRYEEDLVDTYNGDEDAIETANESVESEMKVVDSRENQVSDIKNKTNDDIEETISKEENRKKSNYFIEYRLSRDKLRATLIERLNKIIENDKTTEKIRTQAQQEIISIGNLSEKELYIEGLLKSKGFEDALVFLREDKVRVVVSVDKLTKQDVMKILDIVKEETKLDASNIKIMEKF